MSSSLSPLPPSASDFQPFEAVRPSPARPTSVLKHRAYSALKDTMVAESSTAHLKRQRAAISSSPDPLSLDSPSASKRYREGTPICEADTEDGLHMAMAGASTAPQTITTTNNTTANSDDAVFEAVDDETRHAERPKSSERDEPSVLFSEQVGIQTEPTEAVVDLDDGEFFVEHNSPTDEYDQEPEVDEDADEAADDSPPVHSRSRSSSSASDPDGATHFDKWDENRIFMRQFSSSDGIEPLSEWENDAWRQYEVGMTPEEIEHYRQYNRKIARARKQRQVGWTDSELQMTAREREPRLTRELFQQRLMVEYEELISYHSGDTDDFCMDHRPVLDRAGVKRDIKRFAESIEALSSRAGSQRDYQVVDRLGEGTFSSVYLAYDRRHGRYNNDWWTNKVDSTKRSNFQSKRHQVKVALKRILATSSPQRIENELEILESLRGCRNVSQLITAFRQDDQVIIVLPYHQSDDFRHFYRHLDQFQIANYMKALLRGLADIHARGIIHRDVKPANFLFDYESGDGVLCDFGLAERYVPPRKPTCQHGAATLAKLGGVRTKTGETSIVEQAVYDARKRSKLGEGRIGFPQDDKRSAIKTNRAGTRGFRAPEVLLKCPDQTAAIDVWSAGVMLLSLLSHKFPIFNSSDDIEALMEIAAMFGRNAMEKCAMLHNRTIMTNVPTVDAPPVSLTEVVLKLNPYLYTPPPTTQDPQTADEHILTMDRALDLCGKLLKLDATKRISAKDALNHEFFRLHSNYEKEVQLPLLSGVDGKCGHLHSVAEGKHQAWFYKDCQDMRFGEGIPTEETKFCPEHEHWQQRTLLNPISTSNKFTQIQVEEVEPEAEPRSEPAQIEEGDELEVVQPTGVFGERDPNLPFRQIERSGHGKATAY